MARYSIEALYRSAALETVNPRWAAFFPGPMDGFVPAVAQQSQDDLKKVKAILRRKKTFKQAPGLAIIAYGGGISRSLTKDILRLLNASAAQLSKFSTAHQVLRCCAYIAATTRDTKLSSAVINWALRLVNEDTDRDVVSSLLLVCVRACSAHGSTPAYYQDVAAVARKFAYSVSPEVALSVRGSFSQLGYRDPKLVGVLGQANAILVAKGLAK